MFGGADGACWEGGDDGGLEDEGDDRLFGFASNEEEGLAALVDAGKGEGHAPSIFFKKVVCDDEFALFLEGCCFWEERCGMAIFAKAEHDEVEKVGTECPLNGVFIVGGVFFNGGFRFHTKNLRGGDRKGLEVAHS